VKQNCYKYGLAGFFMGRKEIFLILVVGFLLVQSLIFVSSQSCISNFEIELNMYEVDRVDGGNQIFKKSFYQPNGVDRFVRGGDVLFVESLYVEKNLSCLKEIDTLTIQFKEPNLKEWTDNLVINLNFNDNDKIFLKLEDRAVGLKKRYVDHLYGNKANIYPKTLDKEGTWGIRMMYQGEQVHESWIGAGEVSQKEGFRMVNNNLLIPQRIEVLDRIDVTQLETLRQIKDESEWNSWIVIIIGVFTILAEIAGIYYLRRTSNDQIEKMQEHYEKQTQKEDKREEEKQLDLLRTLLTQLDFLKGNLIAYRKTFSGEGYPLYGLLDIDTSIYFKGLSHKIKNHETISLKEDLILIRDKSLLVNNFKTETKKLEERNREELVRYAIKGNRKQIIKIIDEDLLPVIKKSKKFIKDKWKLKKENVKKR